MVFGVTHMYSTWLFGLNSDRFDAFDRNFFYDVCVICLSFWIGEKVSWILAFGAVDEA